MLKKSILLSAAIVACAAIALAQPPAPLDVQIVVTGAAIDAANDNAGTATGVELDGVAVTGATPTVYYFDSQSGADELFTGAPTPTVFATRLQLTGGNCSAGDLDADTAGNLYTSIFSSTTARQYIWKIPSSGFGSAAEMVAPASAVQLADIEVDAKNSRLVLCYNDAFGVTAEDLVTVPLTAVGATPTSLATEAALEAVLAAQTGYTDDTLDDVNLYDFAVQSDGDIIASHGFTSTRPINGTLLKITETGTVSVFATAASIITAAGIQLGTTPGAVNIGSVHVEKMTADKILIHVEFTSGDALLPPFIGVLDANGGNLKVLASEAQLAGDADAGATAFSTTAANYFFMDGKDGDLAANDDYYFYRQQTGVAGGNAVLALKNINAFLVAGVDHWSIY